MVKRKDILIPLVRGRSVLHIGAAGTNLDQHTMKSHRWLHGVLALYAQSLVAVDINQNACRLMNEAGYKALCANAEEFSVGATFDIVAAPEILEHLSNPGLALNCFRKHLKPSGKLFVSVPNAYCFSNQFRWQMLGHELVHPEHVCWYSKETVCHLLKRHGFKVEKVYYCPMYPPTGHSLKSILKTIPIMFRSSWRDSIVCVCSR